MTTENRILNQHDVAKIMGDDFEPNCTTQEAVARTLLSTTAVLYAASSMDGGRDEDTLPSFVQQLVVDVGTLVVRQLMPSMTRYEPLPDGPLHDCSQLAASLLDSLCYASKPGIGTVLFLANEICNGLNLNFEQELKSAAAQLRSGNMNYPPGEEGASAAD